MVGRKEITEIVTQDMLDANPTMVDQGLTVGMQFTRPETDEEVVARDPEARLVKDNVTQEMLNDDSSFTERGLAVGDEFERLETDEEREKRLAEGTATAPTSSEESSTAVPSDDQGTQEPGRHATA